jgi:GT2 family glycosyltransferase
VERFARSTYLGRSVSRFPAETLPRLAVRASNGTGGTPALGLPEVYNSMIQQAGEDDILLFVHDDVYLHDWFLPQRLTEALERWDVVGIAGAANPDLSFPSWGLTFDDDLRPGPPQEGLVTSGIVNHHDYGIPVPYSFGPTPMECELLDGLFMAVRAATLWKAGVSFDTQFQFHLYDIDFCRSCRAAGLTLGTWPIAITHESAGGYDTEAFRDGARRYLTKWPSARWAAL